MRGWRGVNRMTTKSKTSCAAGFRVIHFRMHICEVHQTGDCFWQCCRHAQVGTWGTE
jgi:hypothetical protein